MEEGNRAKGETTTTTLLDQLCQELTLCYGDPPRLPDAGSKEASQIRDKGGLLLHPNALPHPPAPVAEEIHG